MSCLREVWTREVAGALEAHAVAVEQMAPGHWSFAPLPSASRVAARLSGEWLVFDAPLPAAAVRRSVRGWDLFTANASLAGGLKLCAGQRDRALRLRAELPLGEDVPVGLRVQQVCSSIAVAATRLAAPPETDYAPAALTLGDDAWAEVDLEQLCGDTQWPFTFRAPNIVMVELDVPGTFQQATVELQPERGVVASVAVLPGAPGTPICEAAAARCLLATAGAIRMVRAAAAATPAPVCFEVVFAHVPIPHELAHAFAALSVAWSSAAREAEVLARDAHIAQLYLLESAKHQGFGNATTQPAT